MKLGSKKKDGTPQEMVKKKKMVVAKQCDDVIVIRQLR